MISVVIPIYREAEILDELHSRLKRVLETLGHYEIIFVCDGAVDDSWSVITRLGANDPHVRGLCLSRNFGQHHAISAGLDVCRGDWTVVMDGDLQDQPEFIKALYEKALEGYDIVFVSRQKRPESMLYRTAARVFYAVFNYLSRSNFDSSNGNFSIISRRVILQYRTLRDKQPFYGGLIHWLGFRRTQIPAPHGRRAAGVSGYTWSKRFGFALRLTLAYSDRPLYLSIYLGLLMSLGSLAAASYIMVRALLSDGYPVIGWASLIVALFLNSGIILVVLGIVGVYLGRVYGEIKPRPLYVVSEEIGGPPNGEARESPRLQSGSASTPAPTHA